MADDDAVLSDDELDALEPEDIENIDLFKKLRRSAKNANRKLREAEESGIKTGYERATQEFDRQGKATSLATTLGYPKLGAKFVKDNPETEVTEDALRAYVTDDLGLEIREQETETPETPAPAAVGAQAAGFQKGTGAPAPVQRKTPQELQQQLLRKEITPDQLAAAYRNGEVEGAAPR